MLAIDTDSGGTINPASVTVSTAAGHGTTSVNATTGAITYTPASGYFSSDTFQYTANTQGATSAPPSLITVDAPPNGGGGQRDHGGENAAVTIAVLEQDGDPVGTRNSASVAVTSAAAHGTTSVNATTGAILYTPAAGYSGTDTFQYSVANTEGGDLRTCHRHDQTHRVSPLATHGANSRVRAVR